MHTIRSPTGDDGRTSQVCNHPLLTYAEDNGAFNEMVIRQCGKMLVLDRVLIKLFLTGHRCGGVSVKGWRKQLEGVIALLGGI